MPSPMHLRAYDGMRKLTANWIHAPGRTLSKRQNGRPDGRDVEFWLAAERDLAVQDVHEPYAA